MFGGEEQGLFGSDACAEIAIQQNWPIDVVINLDMVSYKNPIGPSRIVVEYDQGNRVPRNDGSNQGLWVDNGTRQQRTIHHWRLNIRIFGIAIISHLKKWAMHVLEFTTEKITHFTISQLIM